MPLHVSSDGNVCSPRMCQGSNQQCAGPTTSASVKASQRKAVLRFWVVLSDHARLMCASDRVSVCGGGHCIHAHTLLRSCMEVGPALQGTAPLDPDAEP